MSAGLVLDVLLRIGIEENACTFEEWLSVTIPRTQNSTGVRSSMQFDILPGNFIYSPLNLTSGRACTM